MTKEKLEAYEDDNIIVIEDDIERIQKKGGMYIGYFGSSGALHLAREVINNMVDECTSSKSPGRNIEILLDTKENTLMVSDDGRGIPFDKLEVTCTKNHSSSKMTRSEGGGATAGENGIGLTATNALSERFETISIRDGQEASIRFKDGKTVQPLTIKKIRDKKLHGQTFIFKPSDFYLHVEDDPAIIPADKLEEWVENISYLLPPDVTIRFSVSLADGKLYSKKFKNKNGMYDLLQAQFKKTTDIIHIKDIIYFHETEKGEKFHRYTGVEVALAYGTDDSPEYVNSFCNFVNTIDGGTHVNAVNAAILNVLKDLTDKTMSEAQAKKLTIMPSDIKSGLKVLINIKTESNPQFSGQVKEKVNSQSLYKQIRPIVTRGLRDAFKDNEKLLKRVTDIIKTNARARIAAETGRNAVIKKSKDEYLDQFDMERYIPSSVRSKNRYSECLIVEGDSAGKLLKDRKVAFSFQAAVFLKGVSLNSYKSSLDKVMDNNELRTIVRACEAGIGPSFKLENFFFNKIIIMVDADADGNNIFSSLCAFFLTWMRPAVEAGLIYRVLSPLFKIQDKDNPFIRSKQEYFDSYVKNVIKNLRVGNTKDGMMTKDELKDFLFNNRDYLGELERLVNYFGIHPEILEFILMHINAKDFEKKLIKRFPEMTVNGKVISGIYEGKFQYIKIGKRFAKQCEDLIRNIFQPSNTSLYYHLYDKEGKVLHSRGEFTIGQLLKVCLQYKPKILARYKGLGELKGEELRKTTLDPNNRILVQLTVRDMEKAMETVDIFHGKDTSKRKEVNGKFQIHRDDLDN